MRRAMILASMSAEVALGLRCGLRERSSSEVSPALGEKRLSHLYPVCLLIPKTRQSAAMLIVPLRCSMMNCSR